VIVCAGVTALALLLAAPLQAETPEGADVQAPDVEAPDVETPDVETAVPQLQPGEVARIAPDLVLRQADFDRYLGMVFARLPSGNAALQQLLSEALILQAAGRAGFTVDEKDVEAALIALDEQARAATGGEKGVAESLGESVSQDDLRAAVRLLVLHERVVRADLGLADDVPLDPRQLQAWLDEAVTGAALTVTPLDDPQAAVWRGGVISKAAVGNRLRRMLPPDEVSGVLTEMIGVLLVQREAARRGMELTPTDATEEILQRNAALRSTPGAGSITYDQYLDSIEKRTLEEVLKSDKFATEVLLRKIAEEDWTEAGARAYWEENRAAYEEAGVTGEWEDVRAGVWRQLRQRAYTAIFQESRIARRF
jgi:hypothetical protein